MKTNVAVYMGVGALAVGLGAGLLIGRNSGLESSVDGSRNEAVLTGSEEHENVVYAYKVPAGFYSVVDPAFPENGEIETMDLRYGNHDSVFFKSVSSYEDETGGAMIDEKKPITYVNLGLDRRVSYLLPADNYKIYSFDSNNTQGGYTYRDTIYPHYRSLELIPTTPPVTSDLEPITIDSE